MDYANLFNDYKIIEIFDKYNHPQYIDHVKWKKISKNRSETNPPFCSINQVSKQNNDYNPFLIYSLKMVKEHHKQYKQYLNFGNISSQTSNDLYQQINSQLERFQPIDLQSRQPLPASDEEKIINEED